MGDFCPIFTFVMCFCPLFDILRKRQFQSCFIHWNGGHRAIQGSPAVRHFLWNFECSTFSASQTEFFSQVCNFSYKVLQSYLVHWSKWCIQFRRHVILGWCRLINIFFGKFCHFNFYVSQQSHKYRQPLSPSGGHQVLINQLSGSRKTLASM